MIVLNVWNLSTMKGNGSEDSLTVYTNWLHVIVQLPHALGKGKLLEGKNLSPRSEWPLWRMVLLAAAAVKSLQSCPTLCDPRDPRDPIEPGSPPGSPTRLV